MNIKELKFIYQNWKGEISTRTIDGNSINIYYGEVEWHKGEQWIMEAMDLDKQDIRHFALKDIIKYL